MKTKDGKITTIEYLVKSGGCAGNMYLLAKEERHIDCNYCLANRWYHCELGYGTHFNYDHNIIVVMKSDKKCFKPTEYELYKTLIDKK